MRPGWAIAFGVICGLLAAGVLILVASQPRGQPIQLYPPPTRLPYLVQVSGAVAHPGVYPLEQGARLQDAVQAAGGPLSKADLEGINLAAFVEDGERVWVPWQAQGNPSQAPLEGGATLQVVPTRPAQQVSPGLIDLNRASQSELESLPGIGPVIAGRIVAYRQAHGPFLKIEDLLEVKGIGPSILEKIRELVSVGGEPPGPA
jgi:competence protein ComEA